VGWENKRQDIFGASNCEPFEMSAPKISILMPCLNARQYLEPRIDSLVKQTQTNWEAIVLDSYSTDGSWEFFKSIASADSRFRLCQIPRDGLYAALNRGMPLVTGEFLHIATCDDTMVPEFLTVMLEALAQCPEAGIAVCDVLLINSNGDELSSKDLTGRLSRRAIKILLSAGTVRSAFPEEENQWNISYRPAPHDCLLHFAARSVYFSLTQLVVRTALARAAGPFETTVGSVADFGWLLRLTSLTGSVHLPKKLAMWRFHGDQLSVRRDKSRRRSMKMMCERALPKVYERYHPLLTRNDCAALLALCQTLLAPSAIRRLCCRSEAFIRLWWMSLQRPATTLRMIRRARFRVGTPRQCLLRMIFQRIGLAPRELNPSNIDNTNLR
jgi:glycosyltransferase involved in cell wall biosynthesis